MHSAIGPDMNIHAIEITQTDMSDSEGMDRILPTDISIDRVIADGACCSIERAEALKTPNCTTRRCNTFWIKAALMRSIKNMATGRAR
jgi:hypothetical protein